MLGKKKRKEKRISPRRSSFIYVRHGRLRGTVLAVSCRSFQRADHTAPRLVYPSTSSTYKGAASISSDDEIRGRTSLKYRDEERRARRYLSSIIKWRPRQNFANKNVTRQRDGGASEIRVAAASSYCRILHIVRAECTQVNSIISASTLVTPFEL